MAELRPTTLPMGVIELQTVIPRRLLNEGHYRIELLASLHYRVWILNPGGNSPTISFAIQGGLSDSPFWDQKRPGLLAPVLSWDFSIIAPSSLCNHLLA
jgi:lipopolysaccharide transport system ATP-binding protein